MPDINFQDYRGSDEYSDGPIEDELLALAGRPESYGEALARETRWPILYHLSPERRNLLEWFPFRRDAALIEIGAGCGALTGLFAERTAQVTAVELSARRCRIIAARHARAANLEIRAGNIADMEIPGRFDYATLIGVLEYARAFLPGAEPARILLERAARLLKPDGLLFVALENRLGLKYWAGAREDHTGRLFDGLEGYPAGGNAETFSRPELIRLLKASGFRDLSFYYPHPDYKLPREIFSDNALPQPGRRLEGAPNYDQERLVLFDEPRVWQTILNAGQFPLFANSFLVLARPDPSLRGTP